VRREEREREREGEGGGRRGGEGEVRGLLTSRRRSHESAMVCTSFKSTGAMPACGASAQRTAGERERERERTRACCCACCCCCCGCRARIACAIGEALSCADACADEGDAMTLLAADAGADDAGEHAGASGTACAYTPAYVRMRQRILHSIFMCIA
jgi:hypothetical protein